MVEHIFVRNESRPGQCAHLVCRILPPLGAILRAVTSGSRRGERFYGGLCRQPPRPLGCAPGVPSCAAASARSKALACGDVAGLKTSLAQLLAGRTSALEWIPCRPRQSNDLSALLRIVDERSVWIVAAGGDDPAKHGGRLDCGKMALHKSVASAAR